jgi:TonB family protein
LTVIFACALHLVAAAQPISAGGDGAPRFEAPPAALGCLLPRAPELQAPAYPADALAQQQSAVVRVKLTFTAPDQPPAFDVVRNSGSSAFADAVRERVLAYRVPCLAANAVPLVVSQEFQFVVKHARAPVFWGPVRSDGSGERLRGCADMSAVTKPVYPGESLRRDEQGNVIMQARFERAGQPPEVRVLYDGGSARLGRAASDVVEKYRMKCLGPAADPIEMTQVFKFRIDPATPLQPRTFKLAQLLADVDDVDRQHVRFDFNQMACPFELTFEPRQPYTKNMVGQVGAWSEDRRELVEWLRTLKLKIPEKSRPYIIGETLSVAVPCGELDLL